MLPFIQQMIMGTNYILSTDTRDTAIIPSPSSKEPIDYEGRPTEVKILIWQFQCYITNI